MNKLIVVLWGRANVGKSSTIVSFANLLLEEGAEHEDGAEFDEESREIEYAILNYGKTKIGITSMGDPNSGLDGRLKKFKKAECDIIVCATRTYGETVKAVDKTAKKAQGGYEHVWLAPSEFIAADEALHDKNKIRKNLHRLCAKHMLAIIDHNIIGTLEQ